MSLSSSQKSGPAASRTLPGEESTVINGVLTQSCWGIQEVIGTAGPLGSGLGYVASMQMKDEGPGWQVCSVAASTKQGSSWLGTPGLPAGLGVMQGNQESPQERPNLGPSPE